MIYGNFLIRMAYRLFPIYFEKQLFLDKGEYVLQRPCSASSAFTTDEEIVRIADESMAAALQFFVQFIQHDVAENRT
jgi:hypothetical protein